MNAGIIKKRIKAIHGLLSEKRIDSLLVTKPANVTYITGFSDADSWTVITKRGVYLLTDGRYTQQATKECSSCRIIERTDSLPKATAKLLKKLKSVKSIAVEKSVSVANFEALKKNIKTKLRSVANVIETQRSVKDSAEIAAIETAARIAAKALRQIRRYIKPGITENEVAGILDFQIRKLGAKNSFDTIVAFGPNASRPHHQPTDKRLKTNDTILIDFGVRYKGYCCDLTRCFALGKSSVFYRKVYNAVQESQAAAIKMIKAGVAVKKVDAAARKIIAEHDLPVYSHGTGHGLGLEVHEEPIISEQSKGKLQAGMVFTIEPAVYIPGKLGVRIEDDILVTETGCRILSIGISG